jgi:hypothetical protein
MWSARCRQRDLFDEKPPVAEFRPDLRNKLALLLQTLLAEAAGVQQRLAESEDRDGGKIGDDQHHA